MFDRLQYCKPRNYRILYLDETSISNTDHKLKSWAKPNEPIEVNPPDRAAANHTAITVIDKNGVVHYKLITGWNNTEKFLEFLNELKEKIVEERVTIVLDNASVHHAKLVKTRILLRYGWIPIYNQPYAPKYMPIEHFFAVLKHQYRLNLLEDRKRLSGE